MKLGLLKYEIFNFAFLPPPSVEYMHVRLPSLSVVRHIYVFLQFWASHKHFDHQVYLWSFSVEYLQMELLLKCPDLLDSVNVLFHIIYLEWYRKTISTVKNG